VIVFLSFIGLYRDAIVYSCVISFRDKIIMMLGPRAFKRIFL